MKKKKTKKTKKKNKKKKKKKKKTKGKKGTGHGVGCQSMHSVQECGMGPGASETKTAQSVALSLPSATTSADH